MVADQLLERTTLKMFADQRLVTTKSLLSCLGAFDYPPNPMRWPTRRLERRTITLKMFVRPAPSNDEIPTRA